MSYTFINAEAVSAPASALSAEVIGAETLETVELSAEVVSKEPAVTGTQVSPAETALYSVIGFLIVFAVLLVLMAFIGVMSKVVGTSKKKPKEQPVPQAVQAPAPKAEAAPQADAVAVDDGACVMKLRLNGKEHNVSVKEQIPQFTLTLGGKTHSVDVQPVDEEVNE